MSNRFDTPPKGAPYPGTTPPRATNNSSPEFSQAEANTHASASYDEKWRDTSHVGNKSPLNGIFRNDPIATASMNTNHYPPEVADLHFDAVDVLMSPSCPPLPLLDGEEKASAEDSPPVQANGQSSQDSPDIKSTGSDSSIDAWQARFEELKAYKAKHSDLDVPQKYGPLGVWVNKQRNEYTNLNKKGMKSQMTQERISQLNSIGFRWAEPKGRELWNMRFNELKEYKEKVRHTASTLDVLVCEVFITFLLTLILADSPPLRMATAMLKPKKESSEDGSPLKGVIIRILNFPKRRKPSWSQSVSGGSCYVSIKMMRRSRYFRRSSSEYRFDMSS